MSIVRKIINILCAIYTRVSTEDQVHAVYGSLEKQGDMCLRHIESQEGWSLLETFSDSAISGMEWDRPGLQELLSRVAKGLVKMVVVYSTSRLSRKLVDSMNIFEHLYKHGCGCYSISEGFIDISTPEGRFYAAQRAAQNELDHGKIVRAVQEGVTMKIARGCRQGSRATWGYVNELATSTVRRDPVVSKIVRELFERVAAGETLGSCASDFNARGIRTPFYPNARNGRGAGGHPIDTDFLWAVIKNPAYKGYNRTKVIDKPHIPKPDAIDGDGRALYKFKNFEERIVDDELWALANAKAAGSKRKFSSPDAFKRQGDSPLMGLIKCGHCGCGMTPGFTNKKTSKGVRHHRYYRCQKVADEGKACSCSVRNIAAELAEAIVFDSLGPLGEHPDAIRGAVAAAVSNKRDNAAEARAEMREIDSELRRLKEQETNLIAVLRSKGAAALTERLSSEIEILKDVQSKRSQERLALAMKVRTADADYPTSDSIAAGIAKVGKIVTALTAEKQHELLRLLITDIAVFALNRAPAGASQPVQASTSFWRFVVRIRGSRAYLLGESADPASLQVGDKKREPLTVPMDLIVEVPFRWQEKRFRFLGPFVAEVVPAVPKVATSVAEPIVLQPLHALAKAVAWGKELRENPKLTQSAIAARDGLERASVCQYLRLLKLPDSVRIALLTQNQSAEVLRYFGLRQLLRLFKKSESERGAEFFRLLKAIKETP